MTQERLQDAKVGASRQQVSGEGMPEDVRAHASRSDAGVGGQLTDDLEKPHPAKMRFPAGK